MSVSLLSGKRFRRGIATFPELDWYDLLTEMIRTGKKNLFAAADHRLLLIRAELL